MSGNVTPFPEGRGLFAGIDTHLAAIDALDNQGKCIKLALDGLGIVMGAQKTEGKEGDLIAAIDGLILSYLAIGTLLGARRDLMVKALRPE